MINLRCTIFRYSFNTHISGAVSRHSFQVQLYSLKEKVMSIVSTIKKDGLIRDIDVELADLKNANQNGQKDYENVL